MTQPAPAEIASVPSAPVALVVSTLSTASNNAVRKAALIAQERGWALRVLHVERDARRLPAAQEAVKHLCEPLAERLGIAVDAQVSSGDLLKQILRHAQAAELLVVGTARDNALKEQVGGIGVERLIRLSRIPTLVVKRRVEAAFAQGAPEAGGRYTRVLVGADLEPATPTTVAAAMDIAPAARVEAFHAVSTRAGSLRPGAPLQTSTVLSQAREQLVQLLAEAGNSEDSMAFVGFGHPADAVLARQRAIGAQLVVVGKRQRGLLADFFLGDVTRHVLAGSSADVLVLPRSPG